MISIISNVISRYKTRIRTFGLTLVALIFVLKECGLLTFISPQVSTTILITILLTLVLDLSKSIEMIANRGERFGNQLTLYREAIRLCNDHTIKNITLYHYSSSMVQGDLQHYIDKGCRIRLFIQSPEFAELIGSRYQAKRIRQTMESLPHTYGDNANLQVFQCGVPLSVRGANFDDRFIILGWYSYGTIIRQMPGTERDTCDVRGHDCFGVLLKQETIGFNEALEFLKRYEQRLGAELVYETVG
jgi:hypothetical protein